MRPIARWLSAFFVVVVLAGCGRPGTPGDPDPPEPVQEDDPYPYEPPEDPAGAGEPGDLPDDLYDVPPPSGVEENRTED